MNRNELNSLLNEKDKLDESILFVWGTGNTASLYLEGLDRLKKEGIVIEGYCDNNPTKWGTDFGGKRVFRPDELKDFEDVLVLIASPQPQVFKSISAQLDVMGLRWQHIDDFIFKNHRAEVMKVYDMLDDEISRDVYSELIRCRMIGDYPDDSIVDENQYFPTVEFGTPDNKRVFVDCGAYVGDSIERYIWKNEGCFNKIYAFEPDMGNVNALNYRLERLKREWNISDERIKVFPYGVSDNNQASFVEHYNANNGFGSKIVNVKNANSDDCRIVTIDSIVDSEYSFLKADIESYEYKMLLGAQKTIKKFSPKLAVCIYHNAVDFYEIPLLINSFNKDYKFSVRHYTGTVSDTVLYAY